MDHLFKHCEKTFILKNTLVKHMIIHTGEKPNQCCICDQICLHNSSLKLHMMTDIKQHSAHTREKSSRLRHCNKAFGYKFQHLTHERTHNEEKSYSCSHHNMSFAGKYNDLSAVRVSHINFIFYLMRETTLGRNHTVAVTATRL